LNLIKKKRKFSDRKVHTSAWENLDGVENPGVENPGSETRSKIRGEIYYGNAAGFRTPAPGQIKHPGTDNAARGADIKASDVIARVRSDGLVLQRTLHSLRCYRADATVAPSACIHFQRRPAVQALRRALSAPAVCNQRPDAPEYTRPRTSAQHSLAPARARVHRGRLRRGRLIESRLKVGVSEGPAAE
jgi:hypothetical protein